MKKNDNIWVGSKDLNREKDFVDNSKKEFFELPVANELAKDEDDSGLKSNRRDFLKYLGFGLGAATVAAACETPVRRAIPYVNKPDAIVPGVANYYASSFVNGSDFVPILVKTREGRPIKIEGNKQSPISKGGTNARAQASVLELYDSTRIKHPGKIDGSSVEKMTWKKLDENVSKALNGSSNIRFVSASSYSPSVKEAFVSFQQKFPNSKWVNYESNSNSAILLANEKDFGKKAIPSYRFDEADTIVNFGADFLGSWVSPVEFAQQWSQKRKIKDYKKAEMSRMIAFESFMSLTGSNADSRVRIRPSEQGLAIAKLHNEIAKSMGAAMVQVSGQLSSEKAEKGIVAAANDLMNANKDGKTSLVVSGSNNTAEQQLINHINYLLGNYGSSIRWDKTNNVSQAVDADFNSFIDELNSGQLDAVIFVGNTNPVYSHPRGEEVKKGLQKVNLSISTSILPNETFSACKWAAPEPHFLESWGDAEPQSGHFSFVQPTIAPLFDSRNVIHSLLKWSGLETDPEADDNEVSYQFIRNIWEKKIFPRQNEFMSFRSFWDNTLHDGFFEMPKQSNSTVYSGSVRGLGNSITNSQTSGFEIAFFETINMGDGKYANNPWLQEMPDPLSRTVWDNCLTIPVKWDGGNKINGWNGLNDGEIVSISKGKAKKDVTVVQQYGMAENTFGIALGYGRKVAGRAGAGVGVDVTPFLSTDADGNIQYFSSIEVSDKIGVDKTFASVQYHHTFGVSDTDPESGERINVDEKAIVTLSEGYQGAITDRTIIRHADFSNLEKAVHDLEHEREHHQHLNEQSLYPGHEDLYNKGHKWELSVDLSSCIGCGACQIACISENNVPVVGKNEVRRHHEMTWLRIDRYFYGDFDSPNTAYQPMMCQHCDNAPCENVCPVAATNHSSEGLNQMTYNRCIGTRYCANNCPYKVRRFNWLDFTTADLWGLNENKVFDGDSEPFYADNLTRMVLNPDVTVRTRGVIEKCSFCVQRIQEGKLRARTEKRELRDADITTACASACPTGCIEFGDVNDPETQITEDKNNPLTYYALEEVNTQSSVGYKMKVVNKNPEINGLDA
ncbi:MAG: 4Fe-4S dicluster domain-containing protein [Bacteroidetes bacterium]|jgi:molybdopterin-containing oxidoreductase family iron-sulfur binding subunit|nr:4Fe-4S dicluster domain-containing protein [Bacteroidota bacterium]